MLRKRYISILTGFLLCVLSTFVHAHTYKITAVVDTDMALDDIRALTMLLNSHMVDIPLIATLLNAHARSSLRAPSEPPHSDMMLFSVTKATFCRAVNKSLIDIMPYF